MNKYTYKASFTDVRIQRCIFSKHQTVKKGGGGGILLIFDKLKLVSSGVPIQGSRIAMLRGRTAAKCGSCGRWWGKQIENGK